MSAAKSPADAVSKVPYIGASQTRAFERLGVKTVEDLFNYLPRDLIDLSKPLLASQAKLRRGEKVVVAAEVSKLRLLRTPRRRMWLVEGKLTDQSNQLRVIWFNQPYMKNYFRRGGKFVFYGEINYDFSAKTTALINPTVYEDTGFFPVYPLTRGITSRQISRAVKRALADGWHLGEFLPAAILEKNALPPLDEAVHRAHFPESVATFERAKKRFAFNHLLTFILANLYQNEQNRRCSGYVIKPDLTYLKKFLASLPFELTVDQKTVLKEILADLREPVALNRLVQGEVGSGKTVVALAAALMVVRAGYRVVWLTPTEILASQHYDTIRKFLKDQAVSTALLTAATGRKVKSQKEKGKSSSQKLKVSEFQEAEIIIGTHAVLQKNVQIKKLALVVVDEQQRFGVEQRAYLAEGGSAQPHFLSLSATPIPRTLAHVVFGNLDISTIKSQPSGRRPVKTYLVPEEKRTGAYDFIAKLLRSGQQAFVVCPLISGGGDKRPPFAPPAGGASEGLSSAMDSLFDILAEDKKTVLSEVDNLSKTVLGRYKIAALHGKMKSAEKEAVMRKMHEGKIDVLVSTSVVEVGVDVPKATAMVIEDAERFGLSQLHQFRGRIGRSNLQAYCFLFSRNVESEKIRHRLRAFVQNTDGFKLAEMDLKLRGPGAILGLEQAGFRGVNPLWFENSALLAAASTTAKKLLPHLEKLPTLKAKVEGELETEHLE